MFNDFTFSDRQNVEISENINSVFMHYLCQQTYNFSKFIFDNMVENIQKKKAKKIL